MITIEKLWDAFVERMRVRSGLEEKPKNFLGSVDKHRVEYMKAYDELVAKEEEEWQPPVSKL